jgi:hypothetical protein
MPATRVLQVGVISAGAVTLAALVVCDGREAAPVRSAASAWSTAARAPACAGWTAVRLPQLSMIDVAARGPDDVWLLSQHGVHHWDGCTWRAHAPFGELSGNLIEWETIVVDPDGALVITGESEAGPNECHGCVCEPMFPSRRQSYRFVEGLPSWEPIEPRPRMTPEQPTDPRLDDERTIIATSGDDPMYGVVKRTHTFAVPDGAGGTLGYATETTMELWRSTRGAWSIVLGAPGRTDVPTPTRESIFESLPPDLAGLPGDLYVNAFGGSGPRDRWVVGFRAGDVMPDILQFDGTRWISHRFRFRRDMQYRFSAVTSTGPDDVWVVGSWGTLLHFDGLFWTVLEKPSFIDLVDVVAMPGLVTVRDGGGGVFYRVTSR